MRDSTSISPDWSAVNRSLALSGVYFTFCGVAEDGRRHGPAQVDVEPGPVVLASTVGEARQAGVGHAALDEALLLDGVVSLSGLGIRREERDRGCTCRDGVKGAHSLSFSRASARVDQSVN